NRPCVSSVFAHCMGGFTMPTVVVLGALDTKGAEVTFLAQQIADRDHKVLVVDTGVLGDPRGRADITRDHVARAGGHAIADLVRGGDRGAAVSAMAAGVVPIVRDLHAEGRLD